MIDTLDSLADPDTKEAANPFEPNGFTASAVIAGGGTRTHTPVARNWILNPARLPIPPLCQAYQLKVCVNSLLLDPIV